MVNLFWLCKPQIATRAGSRSVYDYSLCAQQHHDAHVIKIALEATQLLYNAHHKYPLSETWLSKAPLTKSGVRGYRKVHFNNPISIWVSDNLNHYRHTVDYALSLCKEYTHRYGKTHGCEVHLEWLNNNEPILNSSSETLRSPPCAMPDEYKTLLAEKKDDFNSNDNSNQTSGDTKDESSDKGETSMTIEVAPHPQLSFEEHVYNSYRKYYLGSKLNLQMARWTKRETPDWIQEHIKEFPESTKPKGKKEKKVLKRKKKSKDEEEYSSEEELFEVKKKVKKVTKPKESTGKTSTVKKTTKTVRKRTSVKINN